MEEVTSSNLVVPTTLGYIKIHQEHNDDYGYVTGRQQT